MPIPVNSLGEFTFDVFHHPQDRGAPPILPAQMGEVIQRAGVDGTAIMRLGIKAEPFQMRSGRTCTDFEQAADILRQYFAAQNDEPLELVWGGINYGTSFNALYVPLHVEPIRIRKITAAAGGLVANAGAWLEAMWTLQPISKAPFGL